MISIQNFRIFENFEIKFKELGICLYISSQFKHFRKFLNSVRKIRNWKKKISKISKVRINLKYQLILKNISIKSSKFLVTFSKLSANNSKFYLKLKHTVYQKITKLIILGKIHSKNSKFKSKKNYFLKKCEILFNFKHYISNYYYYILDMLRSYMYIPKFKNISIKNFNIHTFLLF